MNSYKLVSNITGWLVFLFAAIVYYLTAEPTGSLWDCGEFILGAYKMEVVHPPGAPLFMIVGRMFIFLAEIFSDTKAHPENIAFAVNVMSGICTAFTAAFVAWVTMTLGKLSLVGRMGETDGGQNLALAGAGLVAGLATTFCTSIWFSAVEGEVYAMSTMFTALTMWAVIKWYALPDEPKNDRWLAFAVYSAALSIGVHLLSLLTFPALALFFYFKKYKKHTWLGMLAAAAAGVAIIVGVQSLVITGVAKLWRTMELFTVNTLGMPFNSGLIPTLIFLAAIFFFGIRYANTERKVDGYIAGALSVIYSFFAFGWGALLVVPVAGAIFYYGLSKADRHLMQVVMVSALLSAVGFSTIGVIMVRANADPPINMNRPSDPIRLLSYVNREQYGERALLYGPNFNAEPTGNDIEQRYGQVVDTVGGKLVHRYEVTDEKISYTYAPGDKKLFPRMSDETQNRPEKYLAWIDKPASEDLTFFDNMEFLFKYQLGWMYWRYFFWNFVGRQNGEQGYYSWDKKSGHWESGVKFLDQARLYNMDKLPDTIKKDESKNHYYFLPLIFGLLGLIFHFKNAREEAIAMLALFVITGLGIIIYSNQPPNEPRERDYVLVGSFFTFCIWIGMGVLYIYKLLRDKISGVGAAALGTVLALSAPVLMGTQNWDDHSRAGHTGARDYAANFLESCQPNAIIFTYGDNDTYPLWYAQEVEGIRRDVRVVNLSLIQVDWYIDLLRRKVNDSPPIKLTIPKEDYRGKKRNAIYFLEGQPEPQMSAIEALNHIAIDQDKFEGRVDGLLKSRNVYLEIDSAAAIATGAFDPKDSVQFTGRIPLQIPLNKTGQQGVSYFTKDELAILDVIASNINDRPVYFAVTCRPDKMMGLQDYMQLEGLGLRIVPVKSTSEQGLYVYGYGRVATDRVYDNVMNKFRWGNFDKHETYINTSYGPSIQSLRVVMLRAARRMNDRGEKEKAIALVEKYLQSFPNFNFPYDWNTMQLLSVMTQAGGYEKAKPHLQTVAENTVQQLAFLRSLNPKFIAPGDEEGRGEGDFYGDFTLAQNTKMTLLKMVEDQKDEAFLTDLKAKFQPFE